MKGLERANERTPHGSVGSEDGIHTKEPKSAPARASLEEHIDVANRFMESAASSIDAVAHSIVTSLKRGGKVLVCGNGGSAADSQHFVAELVGRFGYDREPLMAVSLTTNTSILTAVANDYGYEEVFKRQLVAIGKPGDVLVGISTSGKSPNVVAALAEARRLGIRTISFVGSEPELMGDHSDYIITVPSRITARIQEMHITAMHVICELVEKEIFPRGELEK
jgi:D-sedoheptulose 7-phosphate isomerase